jgi:hypothetical protein
MSESWEPPFTRAVTNVLAQGDGAEIVLGELGKLPHAQTVEVKTGWFSRVAYLALGDRRFRPTPDGRILAQHVVGDVAVSSDTLAPGDAGLVITSAVRTHIHHFGPQLEADVVAITAGLQALAG